MILVNLQICEYDEKFNQLVAFLRLHKVVYHIFSIYLFHI